MNNRIILVVAAILVNGAAIGQGLQAYKFGKGLRITAKDSSMNMKITTRAQNRYEFKHDLNNSASEDRFYVRRARLKFDGFAFSPKFVYKFEFDLVNGQVLDAAGKWNFAGNFNLWFGQTKLAGNRERVISSQKLQFVDRSLLNDKFTLDRDAGFQLRHYFKLGKMVVREVVSVAQGEGLNFTSAGDGRSYTGRLELLPFGAFEKKGDYVNCAIVREQSAKLALGITYDYNDNAQRERGQKGNVLNATKDLQSIHADMMFKYKGISVMGEYALRQAAGNDPVNFDTTGTAVDAFYTGTGLNAQIGFMTKSNWEFAFRQTTITPETSTLNLDLQELTFGIGKFFAGHNLKVQSDIGYHTDSSDGEFLVMRFQMEISF